MPLDSKEAEIVVTIDDVGKFELEVRNVPGPACKALSRPYEELFPGCHEVRKTDEYHQSVRQPERKQQKL